MCDPAGTVACGHGGPVRAAGTGNGVDRTRDARGGAGDDCAGFNGNLNGNPTGSPGGVGFGGCSCSGIRVGGRCGIRAGIRSGGGFGSFRQCAVRRYSCRF